MLKEMKFTIWLAADIRFEKPPEPTLKTYFRFLVSRNTTTSQTKVNIHSWWDTTHTSSWGMKITALCGLQWNHNENVHVSAFMLWMCPMNMWDIIRGVFLIFLVLLKLMVWNSRHILFICATVKRLSCGFVSIKKGIITVHAHVPQFIWKNLTVHRLVMCSQLAWLSPSNGNQLLGYN